MYSLSTLEVFFTDPLYRTLCIVNWHAHQHLHYHFRYSTKAMNRLFCFTYIFYFTKTKVTDFIQTLPIWNTIDTRSDAHSLIAVNEVSGLLQSTNASDDGIWKRRSINLVLLLFVLSHSYAFKVWVFLIRPQWVAAGVVGVIDFLV